ncbi:hypothetical protein [Persicobacter diffluens]|uniref:Uncharacterized protein n=1 Tax=Persicobacter diffluens TaxID=981 RepID=A0AAN5AN27_9BACT|nr:hypothetical protein PEDI_49440 [Persicobacter diffluens]
MNILVNKVENYICFNNGVGSNHACCGDLFIINYAPDWVFLSTDVYAFGSKLIK